MKFPYVFLYAVLAVGRLHGASSDDAVAHAKNAMSNSLWDVAATSLEEAAAAPDLSEKQRAEILILLAESLVRGNRPDQALGLLEQSILSDLPSAKFWKGQGLAGTGRFADAVDILLEVAKDPTEAYADKAALTAASLQLSLGRTEGALTTLGILDKSPEPSVRALSAIRKVEILLDTDRTEEAGETLPDSDSIPEDLRPDFQLLSGKLALAEGDPVKAETIFTNLLNEPEGQSVLNYNHAAIGRADALAGQGKADAATESLLTFIQEQPGSPLLESMFRRIIDWLPDEIILSDHPTLLVLQDWIPLATPVQNRLINTSAETALGAWPRPVPEISDLGVFATYARAIGLNRVDNPIAKAEARLLLRRIQLLAPKHFLAPRALLTLAEWQLEDNEPDKAFALFDSIRRTAKSPIVRGEAAFMDGVVAFERGNTELAKSLFDQASELLTGQSQESAYLNSALTAIHGDPSKVFFIQTGNEEQSARLNRELSLERALADPNPEEAKIALDDFLAENPDHPRGIEARLAIIEAALASAPHDLRLAQAQIDTLANPGFPLTPAQTQTLALARLKLRDAEGSTEAAIELAKEIIERFPETSAASDARLILGKSLFSAGNYNEARLVLEKLATSDTGTQRAQAALLLAARSAALGATAQSREEALALFDKTIEIDGPLKSLAILEKARLNIEMNRLSVAIESLAEAYKTLSPDDPSRLPTGLLLAEAIYAQGGSELEDLERSLEIYEELLAATNNKPAQYFRLQYLRGLTLEKIPDPENPGETRLGDALSAYFSVLDRPTDPPPPEWEWFERSGFRALSLLENASRWQAAISIAEKIASFGGPRAEEAATRAKQLRLKHMIWEN